MAEKSYKLKQLNDSVNKRVLLTQHIYMVATVMAYLAFTWSTVVLLGGYVTSLEKKDFLCLTLISLVEATRIFNDVESDKQLMENVFFVWNSGKTTVDIIKDSLTNVEKLKKLILQPGYNKLAEFRDFRRKSAGSDIFLKHVATRIIMAPVMLVIYSIVILVLLSPYLFVAIPVWRLCQRDYGAIGGDSSKATLVSALEIFYSLVLVQGVLYTCFLAIVFTRQLVSVRFYDLCIFPKEWATEALGEYIQDILKKSKKDIESVKNASLFSHATELIGSESCDKYVTGVRILGTFAKHGMEEGSVFTILLSRAKIQKLILTLGLTQLSEIKEMPNLRLTLTELREHAARIVAGFADAIQLAQFPGAARCISTLLEGTEDGSSKLIVHGLVILEKLAQDHHNCREICSTPGLLPKIMAPVCSGDLIQDTRIARSPVVRGTFKVLRGLIRVPGKVGRRLRREISCNKQAVTNLESIVVDQDNRDGDGDGDEVQILAMEILLELVKDESVNLSVEIIQNVIKKQVQIFLPDHGGEDAAAMFNQQQKGMAGKALSVLSSDSESNSTIIMEAQSHIVGRLIKILDAEDIGHKISAMEFNQKNISAMEILRNLCKHCALDKKLLNEFLLPKVLQEIKSSKREQQAVSSDRVGDEEKQNLKEKKDSGDEKKQTGGSTTELMEALLSLTLQLYELVGADSFALAVQQEAPGDGAFVANLKNIVDKNCVATPTSLRIVKLCCEIAISMLQRNQYTAHFKDLEFVESMSKASKNMYELESCNLITHCKKTRRPLLSELEKKLKQEL